MLLVGLLPVLLCLWTFGRVPVLDVDRAMKMLNDPAQNAILVDVRPENEYLSMHIAGSHPWPAEEIISLHSLEQIPAEFKGESLLLICNSGVQSAQAADKLISLGAGNVYTIKGGLQNWIAASDPNLSSPAAKIIYASAEGSLSQPMTSFEQMSAVGSGFGIKPLHMLLSAVVSFILLRQKAVGRLRVPAARPRRATARKTTRHASQPGGCVAAAREGATSERS